MGKDRFYDSLRKELGRIDAAKVSKRSEKVIEGFTLGPSPKAVIGGREFVVFNSNDYLGLRHHPALRKAEEDASRKYGSGPGAVRFISGTLAVHRELEKEIAAFHGREDAMLFSSAFATNFGVLHALIKGQSKDSVVDSNTLVVSDELNHRSIIDGIRVAGLHKDNKAIFRHMDLKDLRRVLQENKGRFSRALVVSDGVFSMLGEVQDIAGLQKAADECDGLFESGVLTLIDDAHGVGAYGKSGRGAEEKTKGRCDMLIGTLGKGFGADGGYATGDKLVIDYLRESAATYIYSNSIPPGTAAAALAALRLVSSHEGMALLERLRKNIASLKNRIKGTGLALATDSDHSIQPLLIGDPAKTRKMVNELYSLGYLVTAINYPVVPKGRDEIRVQVSAVHTEEDISGFVDECKRAQG